MHLLLPHISLMDDLLSSLEERLGDFQQGVVHATTIVDLASWPDKSSSSAFGDDEIDTLVEHFATVLQGAGADTAKMSDEWTALKASIYALPDWLQSYMESFQLKLQMSSSSLIWF